MGSNRTQKPTWLLAEPLVGDRVAVLHKNVSRTSGRTCGEQSSRYTGREARRLRSADRTRRRIRTPAGPPQREFCPVLAFSSAGETLPSYLTDESGSRPKSRDANLRQVQGRLWGHHLQVRTPRLRLHLRQHLLHQVNRDRSFADGRRHALHIAGSDIPNRKHPRQAGLEKLRRTRQRPRLLFQRRTVEIVAG